MYFLTKRALYYAHIDQPDLLRGMILTIWTTVEFCQFDVSSKLQLDTSILNNYKSSQRILSDLAFYLKYKGTESTKKSIMPRNSNFESRMTLSELKSLVTKPEQTMGRISTYSAYSRTYYKLTLHKGNKYTELLTTDSNLFRGWTISLQTQCINRDLILRFRVQNLIRIGLDHKTYSANSIDSDDSCIYLVKCYARNQLKTKPEVLQQLKLEIQILRLLDHPRISQLLYLFEDDNMTSLVFKQAKGTSLYKIIQYRLTLKESTILLIVKDVLEALVYMHSLNIVHRKISCRTVHLSDNGRPSRRNRIIIAGTSQVCFADRSSMPRTSIAEIVINQIDDQQQHPLKSADIRAVGNLAYYLATGHQHELVLLDSN